MTEARQKISLDQLGIANSVIKSVINKGLLIQIPGRDRNRKADDLASRMRALWDGNPLIKVTRPSKFAEVRVRGFDVSATTNDVALAVVEVSGCAKEDVRVGALRWSPFGSSSAWVRCPILAARKALEVGKVSMGWGEATVEPLRSRPIICYRCLGRDHSQQQCNSEIDRGNRCYRCGVSGHRAVQCSADKPNCPLCSDLGLATEHVLGEKGCAPHMGKLQDGQIARARGPRMLSRAPIELPCVSADDCGRGSSGNNSVVETETPRPKRVRTPASGRAARKNRRRMKSEEENMEVEV